MQDDLLIEKSAVKNEQLSPNPEVSGESIVKPKEEENTPRDIGNGVSQTDTSKSSDQGQGGSSSVTTPLQLGTGFNVSEPSLNVINTSNTSTASLWSSGSIEDGLLHGLNVPAVNGTLPFQNFPPSNPNPLFNTSLGPQIAPGLPQSQSQQQPQRRAITATHNFPHNISRHIQGGSHPQNVFMAGKGYAASWSTGPQQHQSTWSPAGPQSQNAAGLSPWSRGRSVPNLNPLSSMGNMGSLGNRKPSPTFNHQQHSSMVISPIKFRRSTSYPGKGLFPQPPTFEITNMDESRDALLQYQCAGNRPKFPNRVIRAYFRFPRWIRGGDGVLQRGEEGCAGGSHARTCASRRRYFRGECSHGYARRHYSRGRVLRGGEEQGLFGVPSPFSRQPPTDYLYPFVSISDSPRVHSLPDPYMTALEAAGPPVNGCLAPLVIPVSSRFRAGDAESAPGLDPGMALRAA
ncbi:hypothetical protein J437_LFUL008388 [Ladona fulva]|uniref:Uncharacterized protein n=1 Tax=Ladona fulva TaxID=123851 RepID=A0A8K0K574_LADFU|nr:hypothetical protein J437_LFUL008388 [Ladona fulva]